MEKRIENRFDKENKEQVVALFSEKIASIRLLLDNPENLTNESEQIYRQGELKFATEFLDLLLDKSFPLEKERVIVLLDKYMDRSKRWIDDAAFREDTSDQIFYQGQWGAAKEMKELWIQN